MTESDIHLHNAIVIDVFEILVNMTTAVEGLIYFSTELSNILFCVLLIN